MRHYCTYFDRNYLDKGLALYESLCGHAGDFVLWTLCLDDETFAYLDQHGGDRLRLIRLRDFEAGDAALLAAKQNRSKVEYYWTLTPSLPLYVFARVPGLDLVTYLDADMMFFSSPEPLFAELGENAILITEHRFAQNAEERVAANGRFNVSYLTFRNDARGLACLRWWRERCLEWCRLETGDGKFGDQKYLDEWPTRFPGTVVIKHKGGGVAPWNLNGSAVHSKGGVTLVDGEALIFFHYHKFFMAAPSVFLPASDYRFARQAVRLAYLPYARAIRRARKKLAASGITPPLLDRAGTKESLFSSVLDGELFWLFDPRWLFV